MASCCAVCPPTAARWPGDGSDGRELSPGGRRAADGPGGGIAAAVHGIDILDGFRLMHPLASFRLSILHTHEVELLLSREEEVEVPGA